MKEMNYKTIQVTALSMELRKSVSLPINMRDVAKCKTREAVKKFIDDKILAQKIFQKSHMATLKYQGRKEVLDEWEKVRPMEAEKEVDAEIEVINKSIGRVTPNKILVLQPNEVFVFGSNAEGRHYGGAARTAVDRFGAIMGRGHGMQGQSYAIDSMSGLGVLAQEVEAFAAYAQRHPQQKFLVTAIGCGIAGYSAIQIAPLFACCKDIANIALPEPFWHVLAQ